MTRHVTRVTIADAERPEAWGSGAIPADAILTTHRAVRIANAIDISNPYQATLF